MNNNNGSLPVTYNTEQVANLFKVDVHTVRRWIDAGKLTAYKVGKRWLYKEDDVLALFNSRTSASV